MTYDEAREAQKAFKQEFLSPEEPWVEHVASCGVTYRDIAEWYRQGGVKGGETLREIRRRFAVTGKDREWCITVGLHKPLSEELALPPTYQGAEVISFVSGE